MKKRQSVDAMESQIPYEEYLLACRMELARQCRWTLQQATSALGNVIGCQERGMTVEEAVQDAMLDIFND